MIRAKKAKAALLCAVGTLASPALAQEQPVATATAAEQDQSASSPALAQEQPVAPAAAAEQDKSTKSQAKEGSALSTEIVVTAQRREQSIQKVGIAITAFSGEQLRELNVTDSRELASLTPGVYLGGALAGQNSQFTIRGVTQNDFNDIVEAPNAVYLDDGYIAIGQGQTFALFDIARVEVLKGPQGTLFGRNATGGLIRYITKKPRLDRVEGFVDLNYGIYDSRGSPNAFHGEAAVNVPVGSKVATRVALMWNKAGPYLRNEYPAGAVGGSPGSGAGANLGDDDTLAGRFTTLFEPSDRARLLLSVNAARTRMSTAPYQEKPTIGIFNSAGELINVVDASPTETRASIGANGQDFGSDLNNDGVFGDSFGRPAGADFFGYIDPDGHGPRTSSDFAFRNLGHVKTWGADLNGEFDLSDSVKLASVTDYKHFYKIGLLDTDSGPGNQSGVYQGVDASTFSQEFRLTGKIDLFNWTAGLYYLHINNHSRSGLKFPVGSVVPGAPFDIGADATLKTNSYSAFGQLDWHIDPRLTLITGARIIREQKNYSFFQAIWGTTDSRKTQIGVPFVIGPLFGPSGPMGYADKSGKTLWAGKVQLDFQVNPKLLLYAGVNRGVKAGSYNAPVPGGIGVPISSIPYRPEVLINYEGGIKYTFPDGRTRFNASVFHYDYKDYQAFLFSGVGGIVINADARTNGGEANLFTSPVRGLDIGLSVSYFDAVVKDVPLRAGGPIRRDVKPNYAPPLQASAIVRYEWQAFRGKLSVQGDASYTAPFFYNLRNFDADKYGRTAMVNFGFGWSNDVWDLNFRIKNLTNVHRGIQGFDLATFCGCNEVSYKPPRFFQIGVRYNY